MENLLIEPLFFDLGDHVYADVLELYIQDEPNKETGKLECSYVAQLYTVEKDGNKVDLSEGKSNEYYLNKLAYTVQKFIEDAIEASLNSLTLEELLKND